MADWILLNDPADWVLNEPAFVPTNPRFGAPSFNEPTALVNCAGVDDGGATLRRANFDATLIPSGPILAQDPKITAFRIRVRATCDPGLEHFLYVYTSFGGVTSIQYTWPGTPWVTGTIYEVIIPFGYRLSELYNLSYPFALAFPYVRIEVFSDSFLAGFTTHSAEIVSVEYTSTPQFFRDFVGTTETP